jgi:hypothetical protein
MKSSIHKALMLATLSLAPASFLSASAQAWPDSLHLGSRYSGLPACTGTMYSPPIYQFLPDGSCLKISCVSSSNKGSNPFCAPNGQYTCIYLQHDAQKLTQAQCEAANGGIPTQSTLLPTAPPQIEGTEPID